MSLQRSLLLTLRRMSIQVVAAELLWFPVRQHQRRGPARLKLYHLG